MISRQEKNIQRLVALDEKASRLMLKPGMGIADVRATYPDMEIVAADPQADRRLLEALADWCDRYTPLVALDGCDGLFLDVTGCCHLCGGENAMLADMLTRFHEQGFRANAGMASTAGAAWAAARFSDAGTILREGEERSFLQNLPLAALRLEAEIAARLESVGLMTIGMVADIPRAPLVRRFGPMPLLRIEQAFGEVDEIISPRIPVATLSAERHLAEPVALIEDIERLVFRLADSLKNEFERRGEGARLFELLLFRVDGALTRIFARASLPLQDPVAIGRLFHERLSASRATLEPGYGFDLVRLGAFETTPVRPRQSDLTGDDGCNDEDVVLFADRVRARLGNASVLQPRLAESHLPERASLLLPFAALADPGETERSSGPERPLRLFSRPEPIDVPVTEIPEGPPLTFRWRRRMHRVTRAEGPERIGPEWWLARIPEVEAEKEEEREEAEQEAMKNETECLTRDYFRVEDAEGHRFWLYREGRYGSAVQPRWFMQGLFA